MKYTPENITTLAPDEIFVFGSNLQGSHGGGAARTAFLRFGAVMGQGVGLQGQSYAIPTMQGGVETIRPYVDEFIAFATECDQNTFLVTQIGCGIAGFTPDEIAPLFADAWPLYNVRLPESFVNVICSPRFTRSLAENPLKEYTYADMVADYQAVICRFRPYLAERKSKLAGMAKERADSAATEIYTPVKQMFDTPIVPSGEGLAEFAVNANLSLMTSYPYYTPYLRYVLRKALIEGIRILADSPSITPSDFSAVLFSAVTPKQ